MINFQGYLRNMSWILLLSFFGALQGPSCMAQNPEFTSPPSENQRSQEGGSLPGILSQKTKLTLDEPLQRQITVRTVGERLQLDCLITGIPTPQYTWYRDGVVLTGNRVSFRNLDYGFRLRISNLRASDAGVYTCTAENIVGHRNTSAYIGVRAATTQEEVNPPTAAPDNRQPPLKPTSDIDVVAPYCQDYKGQYCNYLKTNQVYVTTRGEQDKAERYVIHMVSELMNIDMPTSSQCFLKSVEAMCYYKMPLCSPANQYSSIVKPRRLCQSECMALFPICKEYMEKDGSRWKLLPSCNELNNDAGCVQIGLVEGSDARNKNEDKSAEDVTDFVVQVILPIILGLLVVVGIIVTIVCVCRKKRAARAKTPASNLSRYSNSEKGTELGSLSDKPTLYVKDIPADNIHFLQELGTGYFGKVFKGQVFGLYGNGTASTVFIKTLKENSSAREQNEFQEEIAAMTEVRHQHVLSLLGVSLKGLPQCLMYEHLPLGDLHQFLLSQEAHSNGLQHKEIMYVVTQIASGMEYLAAQNCIHKDLATRNIIVSHNLNVKISNLCITYGLHSADYYQLHNRLMGIRWLPPETITYGKFTLDSDIYSYGVLMWEVFSHGQQPYSGFSNQEVIEMVRSRQLLPCPADCPPRVYSLMMECWHEKPSKRPSAKEVHQKMRAWYLDNTNLYAMSSTSAPSAPSVSTSTAPSHHSSTGPSNPSNQTNLTGVGSNTSGDPLSPVAQQQKPYMQPGAIVETPPYYNSLYPVKPCPGHNIQQMRPDSPTSQSMSSIEDDDESEYTVPCQPNSQPPIINQFASLNRKPRDVRVEYRGQNQPFLQQDHV